jgi:4-amino-4-deoxy-L-arabinose transferase-like glycosyltransferase
VQPVRHTEPEPHDQPRGFVPGLIAVVVVGALWRYTYLALAKWDTPLLLNDSWYYSAQARQLTQGRWFREIFVDLPGAEHGPLTPIVLAPLSWMDGYVNWQRLVTATIGVAVVALVGLLGREVAGPRAGLVAAAIAAAYPNLWLNDGLVMSESLTALLVSAALLVLVRAERAVGIRPFVWFGVLVGLATLTRSELALFVPMSWLVVWSWGGGRRRLVLACASMTAASLLVVAPWVAFNLVRFERPVLLTTNDGTTLLGAYCDATFDGPHRAGWYIGCVIAGDSWVEGRDPSVRSAAQRREGLRYARENITRLPEMMVLRTLRTFDLYALDDLVAQDEGEERARWAVWTGIVWFWVLAPLAVAGATLVQRRHLAVLAMPLATTVLVSALFYGAHRFRTPLEPVIVVLAAAAITRWVWRPSDTGAVVDREPVPTPAAPSPGTRPDGEGR